MQITPREPEYKIYKTAIYARLSREDNLSHSESIENQVSLLERYVNDRPYLHLVGIFKDNGFTGTDFNRPEWQYLMELARNGEVNCILVKDLSRLGRNYIETGEFLEKIFPFFGIRFIAVNDGFDTETSESNGQLSVSLSNIINDYYAKDISRKVSSALRIKMENGKYIGSWEKYGYLKDPSDKNHLVINPDTAPIVRMIYEWRSEGMSYMGINSKLNDMDIPSPGQYKANRGIVTNNNQKDRKILWNKHIITDILRDITYLGHLAQRKTTQCLYAGIPYSHPDMQNWILVENTHEAIIEPELFDKVQEINRAASATAKSNSHRYDYLPKANNVYGKKFTCADCGAVMKLVRSISRNKDKAYFTYKCPNFAEHGSRACNAKRIRKADLDETVLTAIKAQFDLFLDKQETLHRLLKVKQAAAKKKDKSSEVRNLKNKIEHKKALFSGLYRDLRDGLLGEEDYADAREVLTKEIHQLETQLSEILGITAESKEQIDGEKRWSDLAKKYYEIQNVTPELVEAMIESMQLDKDNSLCIQFRYMDEFKLILDTVETLNKEVA